ncbi:MAG: acyl-CoA dehydrogenase [Burkholderiaceae bacterium]
MLALAIDEHAKHRPERIATRVHAQNGGWRLDGQKCFVVDGHVAEAMIVSARDDDGATRLLLVPTDADGVEIERTIMVDAHNAARVRFAGVSLPADAELGAQPGDEALAGALDSGRAMLAAELLGLADEAFERTLRYLAERRQFGRAIGEFQALQHRAAHLYCELEVTRAAVLHALQALDDPEADTRARAEAVAVAKARACASATLAVQEGVQMHGGIGMTDEFEIGFFMKRARAATELLGDDAFHAEQLARLRAY